MIPGAPITVVEGWVRLFYTGLVKSLMLGRTDKCRYDALGCMS